jgi:predicted phage terminase large subunit-like protein
VSQVATQEEDDDEYVLKLEPQAGPQTILLAAADVEEVFFGGALGAGKTLGLVLDFERHHQQNGKITGIALRMTVKELDDMIGKFKEFLEPFGWEYLEGKKDFRHKDGSRLRMRHCESPRDVRRYWGHEYQWMAVDELGNMPQKTCEAIQRLRSGRLRSSQGKKIRFVATGNPCGDGHEYCFERYIKPYYPHIDEETGLEVEPLPQFTPFKNENSNHWMVFIPGRMEDNILMLQNDPKYRDRCKDMGPAWYVEALINGDWSKRPEGGMFHREWFNNRFSLTNPPRFHYKLVSWDTAFNTTADSARSAATVWGLADDGFYLLEAWAAKVEFPELEQKAHDLHVAHNANKTIIEKKASGHSLFQTMKRSKDGVILPVEAIDVDGDKLRRAFAVTSYFDSNKIFVPFSAPWLNEYIEEMVRFPAPGLKDYVDSSSQGIAKMQKLKQHFEKMKARTTSKVVPLNFMQR